MKRLDLWVVAICWTCFGINLGMIILAPGHDYPGQLLVVVIGTVAAIETNRLGKRP